MIRTLSPLLLCMCLGGCAVGRQIALAERPQSYDHCQRYVDAPSATSKADPGRCVSVERAISRWERPTIVQNGREDLNSIPTTRD